VALPFLTAVLMSGKGDSVPRQSAIIAAVIVFCGFVGVGVPTRHRAKIQSISRSDAILAQATACGAQNVILATDSPTLNVFLMALATEISRSEASIKVDTLAYSAMNAKPIEEDFREIRKAEQVVFQDKDTLSPPFANVRAAAYEDYVRQLEYAPTKVGGDISIYSRLCRPRM